MLTALKTIFGDRLFPVFSIKGAIGHTLGPAGAIEAAICARAISEKIIPPTCGLITPEERAAGMISNKTQEFPGGNILTTNSGFGGINAALLIERI